MILLHNTGLAELQRSQKRLSTFPLPCGALPQILSFVEYGQLPRLRSFHILEGDLGGGVAQKNELQSSAPDEFVKELVQPTESAELQSLAWLSLEIVRRLDVGLGSTSALNFSEAITMSSPTLRMSPAMASTELRFRIRRWIS